MLDWRDWQFFQLGMAYTNLESYYKTNFALIQHHKYSLTEIENMIPWEREIYISLLQQYIEEENLKYNKEKMDKTSPVFENFENKMAAMRGKPKINRSTMKIGGGLGLEGRVANNEKKITVLKNIFKAQRQEIGEKITPKVNTLELSLNETSEILGVITEKLSLDMSQRLADQKALFDAQRKKNIAIKKMLKVN